jgi:hypothetical protein
MPDHRGIPPFVAGGPVFLTPLELETAEPNMTVGNQYELVALLVDSQPVPPKPFALMLDDTGHFRLVDLGKVRRPGGSP